ncbi:uncharacterized protein LOC144647842 [Oculina patagonica]
MTNIDNEDRPSVRARLSRNSGYTGLSILHRLYKLYKFDVFKDLVYDVMHNIPLNVAARQIKNWIDSEVIDKDVVEQRLNSFPWTAELLDGRVPRGFNSRLGYWKAEEYIHFVFPASEVIFDGLLGPMDYHIWQLIVRMTELVFRQREVWQHDDASLFGRMAKRFVILLEENYALNPALLQLTTSSMLKKIHGAFPIQIITGAFPLNVL